MSDRTLRIVLAFSATIAIYPFFPWLGAVLFDSVDDRFLDSLPGLVVSVPIGLGLAAIALAMHGLALHRLLVDDLEEGLESLLQPTPMVHEAAPVPVSNGFGTVTASTVMVEEKTTTTATVEAPDNRAGVKVEDPEDKKIPKVGKGAKRKLKARAKGKAKYAFRKELNKFYNRM